ncbi:sporulation-delaying protein SdpB family protein [Flavobacterium sp. UBA7680]|uniref:sporulation-delaying protein SdpB family protein n=1 Tax=Flavobacterium sp. UBA7680 TaxID=1946559 RepID=UPI0025BBE6DE|nr:sporulation-delaying protein SdpB family protein [Flavobacterium sp. UBA7680]
MLKQIKYSIDTAINKAYTLNPWTNVYGMSRTFLALSLLITLTFTNHEYLFPRNNNIFLRQPMFDFEKISIFFLLSENIHLACLISIIILLITITGYLPQITGILHWYIAYSYMTSSIIIEGGDQIASILTLLLIPITLTDNRINHWNKPKTSNRPKTKMFIWSIYFIIALQVSIIYFHAAVAKLYSKEWLNGTATFYWFTHNTFGVSDSLKNLIKPLLAKSLIVISITWGTMLFEIILFSWLFMKRNLWNWKLIFLFGALFHISIAFIHGLISFMFTMIGALILYLVPQNHTIKLKIWKL